MVKFDPERCEGFVCRDSVPGDGLEPVAAKIRRFRQTGNNLLSLVVDWDDTIAPGTWPLLRELMPPETRALHEELYKKHREQQSADTLSFGAAQAWQCTAVGCLVGLALKDIEKKAQEVRVRPGTPEIFQACKEESVPIIVKTGAVKQFVDAAAKENGIEPDLVIATKLVIDDNGIVTGWIPSTLSHSKNKGTLEHPDLPGLQRELTLLIGDGLADRHMVPCEQDSLLIRANGGFEDDAEQILRSFEVNCPYDIVSVEPDLLATAGVVRYILGR